MKYDYSRTEHFNPATCALTEVGIDRLKLYGFFERVKIGLDHDYPVSEGGLWFEWINSSLCIDPVLALVDYDGVYELPKDVAFLLKQAGIHVGPEF